MARNTGAIQHVRDKGLTDRTTRLNANPEKIGKRERALGVGGDFPSGPRLSEKSERRRPIASIFHYSSLLSFWVFLPHILSATAASPSSTFATFPDTLSMLCLCVFKCTQQQQQ